MIFGVIKGIEQGFIFAVKTFAGARNNAHFLIFFYPPEEK